MIDFTNTTPLTFIEHSKEWFSKVNILINKQPEIIQHVSNNSY